MLITQAHCGRLVSVAAAAAVWALVWPGPGITARDRDSPVVRALEYLVDHQVTQPIDVVVDGARIVDFPGNWPQYFRLRGAEWFRVRDVGPFMVAFVHHALTLVTERNRGALGLGRSELDAARVMRRRAVQFIRRFESAPGAPDAGTFGFWPYDVDPAVPDPATAFLLMAWLRGPILGGQRVPINLANYPDDLAIPTDADVTATAYAALLDDAVVDGGSGASRTIDRFFADWRDLGVVPRRRNPSWLPPASGAYLTWLTYREPPEPIFPNDVDLVVNGNVLYALARYGRLSTPGVGDAIRLINLVTARGLHRTRPHEISEYYPNNLAFQYVTSRAFHEGPVAALAPAVAIVSDDLEASALTRADGTVYWDLGDPQLNTGFAVLTLLNAGRHTSLLERAIDYLVSEQDDRGGYTEATFFEARADGGSVFEFRSSALTTAVVLEALVRHELAHCGRGVGRSLPPHDCG